MKTNAPRYIVRPMRNIATIFIALGFSLQISHASFGPTPSLNFDKDGDLACTSPSNCKLPSYRTIQKIGEDFISYSEFRTSVIDKMETEIQAGLQTYGHHLETTFSSTGNTKFKSFLENGKADYEGLLDKLGLSEARQLVGGNSPFMTELKSLQTLLKTADAKIKNALNPEAQKLAQKEKNQGYYNFRTSGNFTSYKYIDQVKNLVDYFQKNQSLRPWMKVTEKSLRLSFNKCPLKVRRVLRNKRPSIKIDSRLEKLKFDIFNHPELVQSLVESGRLLTINCRKKTTGKLLLDIDSKQGSINIDYQMSLNKTPILPLK